MKAYLKKCVLQELGGSNVVCYSYSTMFLQYYQFFDGDDVLKSVNATAALRVDSSSGCC